MKRLSIVLSLVVLFSLTLVTPALAAAPANDTYAGRTTIGGLPFSETIDTSEATTDADDAEWNATCGAPATDASVWYEWTADGDSILIADASGSDYTVGITVVTGAPGTFELVACGPDALAFEAIDGETYSIVAFDDQFDGAGNGGSLSLLVDVAPPPPVVDVTVDPVASFDAHTGSVTVTGTVTCTGTTDLGFIDLQLRQRAGRVIINGYGFAEFVCDGTTQPWSAEVFGDNGLFRGGRAASVTFAVACGVVECGADVEEVTIRIRG